MTTIQPYQGSYVIPRLEHPIGADALRVGVISCPPDAPTSTVLLVADDGRREGMLSTLDLARVRA